MTASILPKNHLSHLHSCLRLHIRPATGYTKIQRDEEDSLPKIVYPHKMYLHLEKCKSKQKDKKRQTTKLTKPKPLGPLLISCKRKTYNWHKNERFDERNTSKLVSLGWKNSRRIGDHFTLLPHSSNPSIVSEDGLTFRELGLSPELASALQHQGFEQPTNIQKQAIPSLLHGDNVICAAETGSGKTLAYLLPVIERIVHQKRILAQRLEKVKDLPSEGSPSTHPSSPYSIIITPSRELTEQVMGVAESLSSHVAFQPHCVTGNLPRKSRSRRHERLNTPLDMLISTPGALKNMLADGAVGKANLQSIVIDESDTLLDDSFVSDIQAIFHRLQVTAVDTPLKSSPFLSGQQIALVSATMPRNLESALGNVISVDSMRRITTQDLHQLMPHVKQTFVRLQPSTKPEKLVQLLKRHAERREASLVFTNNNRTCYFVSKLLEAQGLACQWLHGDMATRERVGVFAKFKDGYSDILVATDVISRGLDTTNVQHVINYDFPTFLSDYVHRVGRVGRVGAQHSGDAVSFVSTKWDVELLWKIEVAARKHRQLDNVDANIKHVLDQHKAKRDEFTLDIV